MRKITFGIILLFSTVLQAQLAVDNTSYSPKELTKNALVGLGVIPMNIKYNGSEANAIQIQDQIGEWNTNIDDGNLGLGKPRKGVILTTGKASLALGPNNSQSASAITTTLSPPTQGDSDLAKLSSGNEIKNVSILEFDFVATGLELNFDYVFASEEYPEYALSNFNDVFGFFLSGPGISGGKGFTNDAENIAKLPNTTTGTDVVSINNVNAVTNSQYYISNGNGTTPLVNYFTQYNGFTTLLRAKHTLEPCQTYHIKIAIANVSDNNYDSGVFIQNFTIPPMELEDGSGLQANTEVCYGSTVVIIPPKTFPNDVTYLWTKDGVVIPDATQAGLIITQDGNYGLKVHAASGCLIADDDILIKFSPPLPINDPIDLTLSTKLPPPYLFNINQNDLILGSLPVGDSPDNYLITYYDSSYQDAYDAVPTGKIPETTLSNYIMSSASKTIWLRIEAQYGSACVVVKQFNLLTQLNSLDSIKLVAFVDANQNGIQDNNEGSFAHGFFVSQQNNTETPINISSPNGMYSFYDTNPGNTYDFSYQINPEYATYYSATATNYNDINIPVGSGIQTLYFPITVTQEYSDVSVSIVPVTTPKPGFSYTNKIVYKNSGIASTSGTITFTKPEKITITSVSQIGIISTEAGFTYNFTNLAPNESRTIDVVMSVPVMPNVNMNDILTSNASISAVANDINLANNSYANNQTVVASYDPNDISEVHGEKIEYSDFASEYLTYTIRFQNKGTASATFVRIEDLLDSQLDSQSIRMINASHNYIMERIDNKIVWQFDNINLTWANQNEELSNGYVTFQIKLKPGFKVGDIIPNKADIYFDYNPAVTTNTFNTEFVAQLSNESFTAENIQLYPNPANNKVQISLNNTGENLESIVFYDLVGKRVLSLSKLKANQSTIDISVLAKGLYMVEITTDSNLKMVKKLVIE